MGARRGSKGPANSTCALAAVGILAVVHYHVGCISPWTHGSVEVNDGDGPEDIQVHSWSGKLQVSLVIQASDRRQDLIWAFMN